MAQHPDYGLDSPTIVAVELALGAVALFAALFVWLLRGSLLLGIIAIIVGVYFLLNALGMIRYSRRGKLRVRDSALSLVRWRGEEQVLDVGCGRGLLLAGAAHHLTTGRAVGVDRWIRGALSGNGPEAARRNAALEGVADRVTILDGDARELPFAENTFDVVVSNFVIHDMDSRTDRERMLQEIVRVLKPGGQLMLVDFIFTSAATQWLRRHGLRDAARVRLGSAYEWYTTLLLSSGVARLYAVTGSKDGAE
ncbi:MAG TPA: class I SAM-dependent methyltransferase [Ktedonobacterales bacterium]